MKSYLLTLAVFIGAVAVAPSANANPNPTITSKVSQAANLVTEEATITSKWNIVTDKTSDSEESLRVSDPECKKINPLEYINNPETFFRPCSATSNPTRPTYEPIEYLKVPKLDSGLSVTVTNF
jgi:hypothetical protein